VRYTSPSWIKNSNNKLPVDDKTFFTPGNALQLHYVSAENGAWNADIMYHEIRGVDAFSKATQLFSGCTFNRIQKTPNLPLIVLQKTVTPLRRSFLFKII
jgi:hypothetical protein